MVFMRRELTPTAARTETALPAASPIIFCCMTCARCLSTYEITLATPHANQKANGLIAASGSAAASATTVEFSEAVALPQLPPPPLWRPPQNCSHTGVTRTPEVR